MKFNLIWPITVMIVITCFFGCSNESPATGQTTFSKNNQQCVVPYNPYNDSGGHDAGFNWAMENKGGCTGNSDSFNEGCEEYHRQITEYNECIANNPK